MGLSIVDAGVLIGALTPGDAFERVSKRRLAQGRASGEQLTLPLSAYSEALVGPFRSGPLIVKAAEDFIAEFGIDIVIPDIEVARIAAQLRAQYGSRLRLPDALVVATAIVYRADRVITTDGRWPFVGVSVEVLQP